MKLLNVIALAALGTVALGAKSHAETVMFRDNFNNDHLRLNGTPRGWTVTSGTVDIIGRRNGHSFYNLVPGHGAYIDMDGSTNAQGTIQTVRTFEFTPGNTYTLSYQLAGSQRGDDNAVTALFGPGVTFSSTHTNSVTHSLASAVGFTTFTEQFTVSSTITAALIFAAVSSASDSMGLLLDNVKLSYHLTPVPLPGAALLMLSGIAGLGAFARRRRETATA